MGYNETETEDMVIDTMISLQLATFVILIRTQEGCAGKIPNIWRPSFPDFLDIPTNMHDGNHVTLNPHTKDSIPHMRSETVSCDTCVFPFQFAGRVITTCTTIDGDPRAWCATSVNSDTGMTGWGYCEDTCPGVTADNPEHYIHPDNMPGHCVCGVPNKQGAAKIVGGSETQIAEYPWQVGLLFGDHVLSQGCGGTLVGSRHVITASHCVDLPGANDMKVLVGDTNIGVTTDAQSLVVSLDRIIMHPDYNPTSVENDIAILVLAHPVDIRTQPNMKPACLSRGSFGGQHGVVSG